MSVSHHHHDHAQDHHHHHDGHSHGAPWYWRFAIMLAAIAVIIAIGAVIGLFIGSLAPTPAPKSPFGMGLREGGAATNGIAAWILDVQADFARAMNAALRAFKTDLYAGFSLIGIAFAYGIFHAAGPGHGKAIVAAYAVATEKQIKGGVVMALGAALVQAVVAIGIVGIFAVLFGATAKTMAQAANHVELASFAMVALVGLWLLFVKSGALASLIAGGEHHHHHHHDHHTDDTECGCGHSHAPMPPQRATWKSMAAAIIAAGIRPCSGAIVVLVFALSQGVFWLGILATFGMAAGTFITTATLAVLTIIAKNRARAFAGGSENRRGQYVATGFETLAAAAVLCLGVALLAGVAAH